MIKNIIILIIIVGVAVLIYMKKDTGEMKNVEMLSKDGIATVEEDVTYFTNTQGFYVYPEKEGEYPGVVMIHEWWGLNDQIKDMAKELAKEGYRVLAVDLFGKVATTPDEARTQTAELDQVKALENLKAAVSFLRQAGALKVASLGWCFGGKQSVELAISGAKLDATVVYYGSGLATATDKLKPIKWPVLGIFGDQDQSIPVETVHSFESSLNTLGVKNEIYIYPGVGHAFANPSGVNHAPNETKDAWAKVLIFLEENLKN
ncbi:MAG: dienelactone hydrolase family protein [Candidatus Zambryskibacteria bacterium]|nr:dienelactone hydrolase family protein [Candidatus Zambryskibacteria bacterium]